MFTVFTKNRQFDFLPFCYLCALNTGSAKSDSVLEEKSIFLEKPIKRRSPLLDTDFVVSASLLETGVPGHRVGGVARSQRDGSSSRMGVPSAASMPPFARVSLFSLSWEQVLNTLERARREEAPRSAERETQPRLTSRQAVELLFLPFF